MTFQLIFACPSGRQVLHFLHSFSSFMQIFCSRAAIENQQQKPIHISLFLQNVFLLVVQA